MRGHEVSQAPAVIVTVAVAVIVTAIELQLGRVHRSQLGALREAPGGWEEHCTEKQKLYLGPR